MATRFDPLADMDRVFNSLIRQAPTSPVLPLDLYRDNDVFVAKVDLPGVDPKTIDIDVADRALTITAERKTSEAEGVQWLTHERPTGTFARQLTLGSGVDYTNITAAYSDGVLTLKIPVAEAAKPRKISVSLDGETHAIES